MRDSFRAPYHDDQRSYGKSIYHEHEVKDKDIFGFPERTQKKKVKHKHYFLKPKHFHIGEEQEHSEDSYKRPPEIYPEEYYHHYYDDDPEASTSQESYYDDDISELENSVLGHISNAAFSNHHFYDKRIPAESYGNVREGTHRYKQEPQKSSNRPHDDYKYKTQKGSLRHYLKEMPLWHPTYETHKEVLHQFPRDHYYDDQEELYSPREKRFPNFDTRSLNQYENGQSYDNLYRYIQRRPKHRHNQNFEYKDDENESHFDRFMSYGAKIPKREYQNYYDEADYYENTKSYYRAPKNYHPRERKISVLDNIRENLPWPLSMVGRIGENDQTSRRDEGPFPDSIQSILKVLDSQDDVGKEYEEHKVLPFLDIEENIK